MIFNKILEVAKSLPLYELLTITLLTLLFLSFLVVSRDDKFLAAIVPCLFFNLFSLGFLLVELSNSQILLIIGSANSAMIITIISLLVFHFAYYWSPIFRQTLLFTSRLIEKTSEVKTIKQYAIRVFMLYTLIALVTLGPEFGFLFSLAVLLLQRFSLEEFEGELQFYFIFLLIITSQLIWVLPFLLILLLGKP